MIYKTVSEVNIQALPFAHVLLFTCMSVLKALQSLCCMFYTSTFNKNLYLCISHGCFPWTTPFCARKRCNLEGMTAKISVFFPEQNVDLTDLYTRLLTEESCIMHQIKENLFVFLFLELVFPISIYRKTYIRNSKCWLKNRYGARSFRYN